MSGSRNCLLVDPILNENRDLNTIRDRARVLLGGITGVKKMVSICEAFGIKCEIHMSGFGNLQILGATSEDTCEYYERGLLAPELDYETPSPYLKELDDPHGRSGICLNTSRTWSRLQD
jgi:hypothetical protein